MRGMARALGRFRFDGFMLCMAAIALLCLVMIGVTIYVEVTNPCVEKKPSGVFHCYGGEHSQTCYELDECVRRKND